jgi:hypothetical protein
VIVSTLDDSKLAVWNSENLKQKFDMHTEQMRGWIPVVRFDHWRDFSLLKERDVVVENILKVIGGGSDQ